MDRNFAAWAMNLFQLYRRSRSTSRVSRSFLSDEVCLNKEASLSLESQDAESMSIEGRRGT